MNFTSKLFNLFFVCFVAFISFSLGAQIECDTSIIPPPPFISFSQPFDHAVPNQTFTQRIQVIDKYYQQGGPVLFYAGPENESNLWSLLCLFLMDWAREMKAVVIGAEHRYFGESSPPKEVGYQYLTLDNVLADYAAIIFNYTGPSSPFANNTVFVFGGSYGGFLSMMMKIRCPNFVHGSIASAAPIWFYGGSRAIDGLWYDTVADIYSTIDPPCGNAVSNVFEKVVEMLASGSFSEIQTELNLCTAPTSTTSKQLLYYLQTAFSFISQFNFPFKAADKVPFPFQDVCSVFKNTSFSPMNALLHALDIAYNNTDTLKCFWVESHHVENSIAQHVASYHLEDTRNIRSNDIHFAESWAYICCTYFILPIDGGDVATQFFHFSRGYDFDAFSDYCFSKFNVRPQETPIFDPTSLKNSSNIIFSNMFYDPVKSLSLQKDVTPNITLMMINDAGHTQDICAKTVDDPVAVVDARIKEGDILNSWLGNEY